jgi:hypothetical protein
VRLFDERGAHPPYGLVTLVKDLLGGPDEDDGDVGVTRQRDRPLELPASAIWRTRLSCNMTIATSASPNPPIVGGSPEGVLG